MSTLVIASPAKPRRSRTRTKQLSYRPALEVSTLPLQHVDLRPSCVSLVCPDCRTWTPITGMQSRTPKLVPHHAGTFRVSRAERCWGSNRAIVLDLTVAAWERDVTEGAAVANGCRSAVEQAKPMAAPDTPVTSMAVKATAADVLGDYKRHLRSCLKGRTLGRCAGAHRCPAGARLAAQYERLLSVPPREASGRPLREGARSA